MPKIVKQFTLDIPVQRFVNACSDDEIYELWLLLSSPRYQTIIVRKHHTVIPQEKQPVKPVLNKVALPFQSEQFAKAWDVWKEYKRKEHGFKFKSDISERTALKRLAIDSGHNEKSAIAIIKRSIEKGWSGLFPLPANQSKVIPMTQRKNFGQ